MILRVPDYYDEFSCIADQCKDSCCIGWEINIDEDTHAYYCGTTGDIGQRLKDNMYLAEDGEYSFRLKEHGRCPFLNSRNLCDLCIELGEESLSEVCTEYPRFTLDYGNVFQKCLSLSCEEVGRIVFSRETPVTLKEVEMPGMELEPESEAEESWYRFLEQVQENTLYLLENRSYSIWDRVELYLIYLAKVQEIINEHPEEEVYHFGEGESDFVNVKEILAMKGPSDIKEAALASIDAYDNFDSRFDIFEHMETLDKEWTNVKKEVRGTLNQETYRRTLTDFVTSNDYKENDYEQLMVYFTFRYLMKTVYDYNLLAKGKMIVAFTKMIRDMDAVRFVKQDGVFTRLDRIDTARIFSKEVEHSEENVEYAEEEFEF